MNDASDANDATTFDCEVILVMTWYNPVSGNRYLMEKTPSGAVILVNLKILSVPLLLVSTTTLADKSVTGLPVCKFRILNLRSVGVSIIGVAGV